MGRPESKDTGPRPATENVFFERWHYCDLWRDVTNKSRPKPYQFVEISAREKFTRWASYRALPPPLSLIIQSVKWKVWSVFSPEKESFPLEFIVDSSRHMDQTLWIAETSPKCYENFEKGGLACAVKRGAAGRLWWPNILSKKVVQLICNFATFATTMTLLFK